MSDMGLYSGLYDRFHNYGELLDRVLIELKLGTSSPNDDHRQKLAQLLVGLTKSPTSDFSTQLFAILLRDLERSNLAEWEKVGRILLSTEVNSAAIKKLEKLANVLEYERADVFARMRGADAR